MPCRDDTVPRLMAEALAGQTQQRAILRRAADLGVSGPLVDALLAARSRTSVRTEPETHASIPQPWAATATGEWPAGSAEEMD
jgi:hypothetical protein